MGDIQLGRATSFTPEQVMRLWIDNGGNPDKARIAAAITFGNECPSGNAGICNDSPPHDYSVGLWQINYIGSSGPYLTEHYGTAEALANDPDLQAKVAIMMSNNGTEWRDWGPDFINGYSYETGGSVTEPAPDSLVGKWLAAHGGTQPSSSPVAKSNPGLYRNPYRDVKNLVAERVDQGVDYSGDGPVHAIGPGTIVQWNQHAGGGWDGGYVSYKLTAGPASGKIVYFAEGVTLNSALKIGSEVDSNTVLGNMTGGTESGWSAENGLQPLSQLYGTPEYKDGTSTRLGLNFNALLVALGAPSGTVYPMAGTLPRGWIVDWRGALASNHDDSHRDLLPLEALVQDPELFVTWCFRTLLHRNLEEKGIDGSVWVQALKDGSKNAFQVYVGIASSPEGEGCLDAERKSLGLAPSK